MKTVLLVDNDPLCRTAVLCAFAPHPEFQVVRASSFHEALWAMFDHKVDLVIAHLGLPNWDGLNLLVYLANYHSKVPVLTLSNSKMSTGKESLLCWRGHLSLPLQPNALLSRVQDCLRTLERGEHRPLKIHDLLRILAHERESCILQVKQGLNSGFLKLVRGKISHAECGEWEAEQAVREMLHWPSGWFRLEPLPLLLRPSRELPVLEAASAA
jgi:DNA-binding response OmpR family regulator